MSQTTKRIQATVSGRVQGVSFRAATAEQANALRLSGWVKNLTSGAVELEAQGSVENINQLLTWLHQGPPAANVTDITSQELPLQTEETRFRITY